MSRSILHFVDGWTPTRVAFFVLLGAALLLLTPDSQRIPATADLNGSSFTTDNVIPAAQLQGAHPFGEGPYAAPYSFYLGTEPEFFIFLPTARTRVDDADEEAHANVP